MSWDLCCESTRAHSCIDDALLSPSPSSFWLDRDRPCHKGNYCSLGKYWHKHTHSHTRNSLSGSKVWWAPNQVSLFVFSVPRTPCLSSPHFMFNKFIYQSIIKSNRNQWMCVIEPPLWPVKSISVVTLVFDQFRVEGRGVRETESERDKERMNKWSKSWSKGFGFRKKFYFTKSHH